MAILQNTVDIKITKYNIDYYLSKGYDVYDSQVATVKVHDLSHGSGETIQRLYKNARSCLLYGL